MAAALTVSIAGVSYAGLNRETLTESARSVADRATCRTVNEAIVGYTVLNDRPPTSIGELAPLVQGDVSAYRIVLGVAAGPGC